MVDKSLGSNVYFQTITLVLHDGTEAHFTGRYQIPADVPVRVAEVRMSKPEMLPAGMSFDQLRLDRESELQAGIRSRKDGWG